MEPFEEALDVLINRKSRGKGQAGTGKVKSVDGDHCVIEREDGLPDLEDVRLNALIGDYKDVFLIMPKVGSEVLYLQVEGRPEENCVIKYTEIDRVYIEINGGIFELKDGLFTVKNTDSDLKKILNDLLGKLKTAIIQTPSGPGNFSPADQEMFETLKTDTKKLFK